MPWAGGLQAPRPVRSSVWALVSQLRTHTHARTHAHTHTHTHTHAHTHIHTHTHTHTTHLVTTQPMVQLYPLVHSNPDYLPLRT